MKRIIVTGAAGFLGSHLTKYHLEAGDKVLGIDDFSSSSETSAHLKELRDYKHFSFLEGDISKNTLKDRVNAWLNYNGDSNVDLIYNFACPASPPRYQALPVHTTLTCVAGTEQMLAIAKKTGAVLVHASTSEVYGDPEFSPQKETYRGCVNSYGPRSCYDEGKRAAEALCYDYLNTLKTDARLVRIFNTYGPNMDPYDGRVVSNFIIQALKGEKLTIYGDGSQTRSFCYVDDLIRGIVALGALEENPRTPVNVGNPNEFTVKELAEAVVRKLGATEDAIGYGMMFDYRDLPTDDPLQRKPDITLAQNLLNWEPQIQLEEGLERTTEYFRRVIK